MQFAVPATERSEGRETTISCERRFLESEVGALVPVMNLRDGVLWQRTQNKERFNHGGFAA